MSRIYVAVDIETTGLDPERDEILEIGAVKFRIPTKADEEPIIARWSTLVNPGRAIPYNISHLTGIKQEELDQAPPLDDVLTQFRQFVGNYPVVGHNVQFEMAFFERHGLLKGQANIDTFELASLLLPSAPRYSLGKLTEFLGITFDEWHRALADAEMTARLFLMLWQDACALPEQILDAIVEVALNSRWPLRSFFAAARRAKRDDHLPLLREARLAPPMPTEALLPTPDLLPRDKMSTLLKPEGPLGHLPTYEERNEQIAILEAITEAFGEDSHLLLETGTGSRSLSAYLIAAIYEAARRGEPIVISHRFFHHYLKLFYEELPFLAESLPQDFSVLSLKKPQSYLCPRRVEMLRQRGHFSRVEARLLARVLIWMQHTKSGDRGELNIQEEEEVAWQMLCASPECCSEERCAPYTCYWVQARQMAEQAHLILVHHSLLINDLLNNGTIIPPVNRLIIDEAHHLEEQATQQFGFVLKQSYLYQTLERLINQNKEHPLGLLVLIGHTASALEQQAPSTNALTEQCAALSQKVEECRLRADDLFESLDEALRYQQKQQYRYHILPKWRQEAEWNLLGDSVRRFKGEIEEVTRGLSLLQASLSQQESPLWQEYSDDCRRMIATLERLAQEIERILLTPEPNDVTWIQVYESRRDKKVTHRTLYRSPIDIGRLLDKQLFQKKSSVILTSPTLTIESDFSFVRERLGMQRAKELSVSSAYNFSEQALVYLAKDMPMPNAGHYTKRLHQNLLELARATKGRMLVLFTSKTQLNNAYRAIGPKLAAQDIIVMAQYMDGPRMQLIERFAEMERGVLLGGYSFWEGIDIPGPALSCLAITRLPFPNPTEPLQAARARRYRSDFLDYRVPQAILRFRQGFDLLLRSKNDRGVVAILDSRIHTKRYGQSFLDSLPPVSLEVGPLRNLPAFAERWLAEGSSDW